MKELSEKVEMLISRMPTEACARLNFLRQYKRYKNFSFMYGVAEGKILLIRINEKNLDDLY